MTSDPLPTFKIFGKRTMSTELTQASPQAPEVKAVADAMAAKREELIAQPLSFIWKELARAAIAALGRLDGYVVAPKEPDARMVGEGDALLPLSNTVPSSAKIYRAMIAAVPSLPAAPDETPQSLSVEGDAQ